VTHGWPGSVLELLKVIEPLTDPTAHGGAAQDAFHLVIPSLPGYGFSARPQAPGWDPDRIARAWDELMKRLGYTRYVAQGGDWGAVVTEAMGRQAPAGLTGIQVNLAAAVPPDVEAALAGAGPVPAMSEQERAVFDALSAYRKSGNSGYFAALTTRPQAARPVLRRDPGRVQVTPLAGQADALSCAARIIDCAADLGLRQQAGRGDGWLAWCCSRSSTCWFAGYSAWLS
jgi:pimeloyl-ACP methyl ester carboxylesterase